MAEGSQIILTVGDLPSSAPARTVVVAVQPDGVLAVINERGVVERFSLLNHFHDDRYYTKEETDKRIKETVEQVFVQRRQE